MRNQKFYSNHLVKLVIHLYLSIIRRACGSNYERHALCSSVSIPIKPLTGRSKAVRNRRWSPDWFFGPADMLAT